MGNIDAVYKAIEPAFENISKADFAKKMVQPENRAWLYNTLKGLEGEGVKFNFPTSSPKEFNAFLTNDFLLPAGALPTKPAQDPTAVPSKTAAPYSFGIQVGGKDLFEDAPEVVPEQRAEKQLVEQAYQQSKQLKKKAELANRVASAKEDDLTPVNYSEGVVYTPTNWLGNSKEAQEAMSTYRLASEAEKRIEQSRKYRSNSVLKNLGAGLSRALDPTIWDNGAANDQQNQLTFQAVQKKQRGEKLTESEQTLLDAQAVKSVADQQEVGDGFVSAHSVGDITANSLPFMLDFIASPFGSVSKGTGLVKAAKGLIKEGINKSTIGAIGSASKRLLQQEAKEIVNKTAMALTIQGQKVSADAYRRQVGSILADVDDKGQIVFGKNYGGVDAGTAYMKAIASQAIENYSEGLGERFSVIGDIMKKVPSKALSGTTVGKFYSGVLDRAAKSELGHFMKKTQWNGTINEFLEENAGSVMNSAIVGDDSPDSSLNVETFLGLALTGGAFSAINTIGYVTSRPTLQKTYKEAANKGAEHFGSDWNDIKRGLDEMSLPGLVSTIQTAKSAGSETARVLAEYAKSKVAIDGYNEARSKDKSSEAFENNIYDNSYNASPAEKYEIKRTYDLALSSLQSGENASEITPEYIASAPEERKSDLQNFYHAKIAVEGMAKSYHDEFTDLAEKAAKEIDDVSIDGKIHQVKHPEGSFILLSPLSFDEDGRVTEDSPQAVVVQNSEGVKQMVASSDLSLANVFDSNIEKQSEIHIIQNQIQKKAAVEMSIGAPGMTDIWNVSGTPMEMTILSVNNDDTITAQIAGEEHQIPLSEISYFYPEYEETDNNQVQDPEGSTSFDVGKTYQMPDGNSFTIQTEMDANGKHTVRFDKRVNGRLIAQLSPEEMQASNAMEVSGANTDAQEEQQQEKQAERQSPQDQANELIARLGDGAVEAAESLLKNHEKKLAKIQKQHPPKEMTTSGEVVAFIENKTRAMRAVKEDVIYWTEVLNDINGKLKKDLTPPKKMSIADQIRSFGDYLDLEDYILRDIALGGAKFIWKGNRNQKGLAEELGFTKSETERKKRISLLNNQGYTPETYAEHLSEIQNQYGLGVGMDSNEVRGLVIDILRDIYSISRAVDRLTQVHRDVQEKYDAEEARWMDKEVEASFARNDNPDNELNTQNNGTESGIDPEANGDVTHDTGIGREAREDISAQSDNLQQSGDQPGTEAAGISYDDGDRGSGTTSHQGVAEGESGSIQDVHQEVEKEQVSDEQKLSEAESQVDQNPSEAQKESGNYKKGHVSLFGFDITIENPKGSVRSGVDLSGKEWRTEMHNTYGYIKKSQSKDGDHVDVFLGDNLSSDMVYVVDQIHPKTGEFDEHKVMLGFDSIQDARQAYLSNYEPGWNGIGEITELSLEKFHQWLENGTRKIKAISEYQSIDSSNKLEDYGDKIGGARKDIVRKYLNKINLNGKTLSSIFPRPNIPSLIEAGMTIKEVSAIKIAYEFAQSDKKKGPDRIKFYASYAKSVLSDNLNLEYNDSKYVFTDYGKSLIQLRSKAYEQIANKLGTEYLAMDLSKFDMVKLEDKMRRILVNVPSDAQYMVTARSEKRKYFTDLDSAVEAFVELVNEKIKPDQTVGKDYKLSVYRSRSTGVYFIGYKPRGGDVITLKSDFKTARSAFEDLEASKSDYIAMLERMLQEQAAEKGKSTRTRLKFYGENIRDRVGIDYRNGQDVSVEEFAKKFGFKGVEFGNWATKAERQTFVNNAFDSFMDLCSILRIDPKAISLSGELSIAFGSRGVSSAVAHYEPARRVISLNKKNGMGSIAHEWFHSLDNYFAGWGSGIANMNSVFQGDVQDLRKDVYDAFSGILDYLKSSEVMKRSRRLDGKRNEDYFSLSHEIGARSFENYVMRKLQNEGNINDFLVNYVSEEAWGGKPENYPYPLGTESEVLEEKFDDLFNVIDQKVVSGNIALFSYDEAQYSENEAIFSEAVDLMLRGSGIEVQYVDQDYLHSLRPDAEQQIVDYNATFNEDLEKDIDGDLPSNHVYSLGYPSKILTGAGIQYFPIELPRHKLEKKSAQDNHPFDIVDLKDLPKHIQNPLAVFRSATRLGSYVIATELKQNGKNYIVIIEAGRSIRAGYSFVKVNSVRSIYTKSAPQIANWISEDLLEYVDKKQMSELLSKQRSNSADVRKLFGHAANVVNNFENPNTEVFDLKSSDGKIYGAVKNGIMYLDKNIATSQTKVHEYTHLWDIACQNRNPELWKRGIGLMKQTSVWKDVLSDPNYSDIREDENKIASEVHARLTGDNASQVFQNLIDEAKVQKSIPEKSKAMKLIHDLRNWVNDFWNWCKGVQTRLTKEEADNISIEDFINMPLADLARGVDVAESDPSSVAFSYSDFEKGQKFAGSKRVVRFVESVVDNGISLKTLQDEAIEKTGLPVESYENAYLSDTAVPAKTQREYEYYEKMVYDPAIKEIRRMISIKHPDVSISDAYKIAKDYSIAKHGIERNDYEARKLANEYVQSMRTEAQSKLTEKKITQKEFEAANKQIDKIELRKYEELAEQDFSGLTDLVAPYAEKYELDPKEFDAIARRIIADFESSLSDEDIDSFWDSIHNMTDYSLKKSYDSGRISKEAYEKIKGQFKYYIPLRGWVDTKAEDVYEYLDSPRAMSGGALKTIKGRTSVADDPFATILAMTQSEIMQANKNLQKQKFYNFIMNRLDSGLFAVSKVWYVQQVTGDNVEWVQETPDIEPEDSAEVIRQKLEDFEAKMKEYARQGLARWQRGTLKVKYKITDPQKREHEVWVKVNGEDRVIYINGNPRAAQYLNGRLDPGKTKFNQFVQDKKSLQMIMSLGQFMKNVYTTMNPEFVLTNAARDFIFSNMAIWVKEDAKYSEAYRRNFLAAISGTLPLVIEHEKGKLFEKVKNGTATENEKYFMEFVMNGGETGYTNIKQLEDFKKDVQNKLKKKHKGHFLLNDFVGAVEIANRAIEDISRFATYKTSRQVGRDIETSVSDAKNVTVNFNRKGSGGSMFRDGSAADALLGWLSPDLMNKLYFFFNAGVQGLDNYFSLFKKSPLKATAATTSVLALGLTFGFLNELLIEMLGGDGDEYKNLNPWVKKNNLSIYAGNNLFLSIPLPHEIRGVYALGTIAYDAMSYGLGDRDIAQEIFDSMIQVIPFNPIDGVRVSEGSDRVRVIMSNFVPDVFKPLSESYLTNKDFMGMPIYKDTPYNKRYPEYTKAYAGTNQELVAFTEKLNEISGGDAVKPGLVDLNPARAEHLAEGYLGGLMQFFNRVVKTSMNLSDGTVKVNEIPFVNKFVKQSYDKSEKPIINAKYYKIVEACEETGRVYNGYKMNTKMGKMEYAKSLGSFSSSVEFKRYLIYQKYRSIIGRLENVKKLNPTQSESIDPVILQIKQDLINSVESINN